MADIVQRNLQRSLAKSVSALEKETGISQSEILEWLNHEYGYVPQNNPEQLAALDKQVELDRAADLHANQTKLHVSKKAVLKTIYDRETGHLSKSFISTNESTDFKKA